MTDSSKYTTVEDGKSIVNIEAVLADMTNEDKINLLSGSDMWHTVAVPKFGIPRVRCSDGPNGVRGTTWVNGSAASCFPSGIGLGASWDVDYLETIGAALGEECRARGVHCLLAPTANLQRHPLGGRGFESYSEDPLLSGLLGKSFVEGLQSKGVMATPKHYVGNEQEHMRRKNDSVIDERTLHELYLEPFRRMAQANPHVFMSSYNRVNGTHVSEDPYLLDQVLRKDFGFDGMIISDWNGTYSSSEAINAGLDLEMPGPTKMRGPVVEQDIISGKVRTEMLDERVRKVLGYVQQAQRSGIPFEAPKSSIDNAQVRSLLRTAASNAVVLLKNTASTLPLTATKGQKIAVIGPNAGRASYSGGGSARLRSTYTTTPLDAIRKVAESAGATIAYAQGTDVSRWLPLLDECISLPAGSEDAARADGVEKGVECIFYKENPWKETDVKPIFTKYNNSTFTYFIDGIPAEVPIRSYVSMRTRFTPPTTGTYEFGLGAAGQADLYVNGTRLIENRHNQKSTILFFDMGSEERFGEVDLEEGETVDLEVRFSNFEQLNVTSPYSGRRGGIRLGGRVKVNPEEEIKKAVELSKASDTTIVVIGTDHEWESEAYDRDTMALPANTDALVEAILAETPGATIVNVSGMPVELPWEARASAIVQSFFGGNEGGTAIADILFGQVNPSGKLPVSWGRRLEDYASATHFGNEWTTEYVEKLGVGYRHFDRARGVESLFPFGHGESYTTFEMGDLSVQSKGDFGATATFSIRNTGSRAGAEVGQVYMSSANATEEGRPEIELAGFAKVDLKPAESKQLSVDFDHQAFSYYSVEQHRWVAPAGQYTISIGSSSREISASSEYNLAKSFTWKGNHPPTLAT